MPISVAMSAKPISNPTASIGVFSNRTDKRRVVVALCERYGRTLARLFRLESDGIAFAREPIVEGSLVAADDLRHWNVLASSFTMERIDHSEAYSFDGAHTNLAESYFARLRRMIPGQHHRVSHQARCLCCCMPAGSKIIVGRATGNSQIG